MIHYILVNNTERELFEKAHQLPYGCSNTSIYKDPKEAIKLLNNMFNSVRKHFYVEKWIDGEFNEIIIKGEWLQ
jgi:hypothetical protein